MDENRNNIKRPPRIPFKTKIKVKLPGFPKFIERYSKNISVGGMFINMKDPKPLGSVLSFEFVESQGNTIIRGEGIVKWSREKKDCKEGENPGIGIEFTKLTRESKDLIKKIIEINVKEKKITPQDDKRETHTDIASLIDEATKADTEKLNQIKTKGFFREELPQDKTDERDSIKGTSSVIGIDLGTTNSCVAFVKDGKPYVIESPKGYRTIPSIVALPKNQKELIGYDAKSYFLTTPERTIYGSKRMLGRKFKSQIIEDMKKHFKYPLAEDSNGDVIVDIDDKKIPLPVISSLILKNLKDVAQEVLGREITQAVITVPAHYSNRQRECVKEAGILAGLTVKRIVNEPTAAALAYGLDKGLSEKILIYDLGGGTFDVSIMDISNNVFEVLASGGDSFLGGIDFDNRIVGYLVGKFKEKTGIDVQKDSSAMQRIKEAAEEAKIDLSSRSQTKVEIPFIAGDEKGKYDLNEELTRQTLDAITADLVNKTIIITQNVLREKKLKTTEINEIILVGGQTRMPLVTETITRIFGMQPKKGVHPDEVVALGAALLADTFGKVDSVVLLDALSVPIGIGLPGGKFKEIIPKFTRIPFEKTFQFTTAVDDQVSLDIDIYQGETSDVKTCEYLGTFVVDEIPAAKKGSSRIILKFSLDSECILHLEATESLSKRTIEADMVIRETPDCIKEQFKKEKEN